MRIGIDIDDTIANTHDLSIEYAIVYDKTHKEGKGIINSDYYDFDGKFDWTAEDKNHFIKTNSEEILDKVSMIDDALEVINKLKEEGNEIYFITSRSGDRLNNPYEISSKWLNKNKFKYDKLITDAGYKGKVCKENNIDILIDDSINNCNDVNKYGIRVLLFDLKNNKESNFEKAHNWKEVYDKLGG